MSSLLFVLVSVVVFTQKRLLTVISYILYSQKVRELNGANRRLFGFSWTSRNKNCLVLYIIIILNKITTNKNILSNYRISGIRRVAFFLLSTLSPLFGFLDTQ